ncbi:transmembrane protein 245-like isoform X2 [Tachypleus tridentatus]|uniref:transmembrane protein 245-like isoform X2 n=1 Tax=Tachypleus tridentatus TaxID=6853 RepID=UPI003FD1A80C
MHYLRSPLDVLNFVPGGHEKALKQAFYSTAAILFVIFAFTAAVPVYFVFEPFIEPLLWAVLFGSFLHPFKQKLTVLFRGWLKGLRQDGAPLALGLVICPFKIIDGISEGIGYFLLQYVKVFLGLGIGLPLLCFIYGLLPETFSSDLCVGIVLFFQYASDVLEFFSRAGLLIWTLVIGYILVMMWCTPQSQHVLPLMSLFVWVMVIFHFATIAGPLRVPVSFILLILLLVGFVTEVKENWKQKNYKEESCSQSSSVGTLKTECLTGTRISAEEREPLLFKELESPLHQNVHVEPGTPEQLAKNVTKPTSLFLLAPKKSTKERELKEKQKLSNLYLYRLVCACILTEFWLNLWLLNLLPLPVIYLMVKKLVGMRWCQSRKEALVPAPVRGLAKILARGDRKVIDILENSIDTFTSISVILVVLVLATTGTIFLSLQIYGESMHLIEVTSNLINRVVVHNPELQQLLPEKLQDIQGTLDSMVGNAYIYGREWIANTVKEFIDEKDETRAAVVEEQILEVWDRIYHMWITRNATNVTSSFLSHHGMSWNDLVDGMKTLNVTLLVSYIQNNIGTLLSVLESVWAVVIGNLSLAFSTLTVILSLVFGGGTAVLNFFLDFVVFSTALFYLLCASGTLYKPVEVVSMILPSGGAGNKLGEVVEQSINGVFAASFKMAAFYGLYTWLIHTIFDVNIIYIPSVLAAIFGAVPFLGAYWACLPAVLELWLVNGQVFQAGLMFFGQLVPSSFVDSTIYSEIKGGGHPYLTGLAIAGGVFCLGFRGALFGPMLLCFLLVAINMYSSMIQDIASARLFQKHNTPLKRTNSQ